MTNGLTCCAVADGSGEPQLCTIGETFTLKARGDYYLTESAARTAAWEAVDDKKNTTVVSDGQQYNCIPLNPPIQDPGDVVIEPIIEQSYEGLWSFDVFAKWHTVYCL